MLISFDAMDYLKRENVFDGNGTYEVKRTDAEEDRVLVGKLAPGASIGMHTHEDSMEAMYFLSGEGIAVCDGKTEKLEAGVCHYCPQHHSHSVTNVGSDELVFFAVVAKK